MLALVQRVSEARVEVDGATVGAIGRGLLVFVCAEPNDGEAQADKLVFKLLKLRIFADPQLAPGRSEAGCAPPRGADAVLRGRGSTSSARMNRSVQDVQGGLLIVSQFTLAADTRGGNRPSFSGAAPPELGRALYDRVLSLARDRHPLVASGVFGAEMQVHLVNDGPVTLSLRVA